MLDDVAVVNMNSLLDEVSSLKKQGYRLATIICEQEGEGYEMIYIFDLDTKVKNLKLAVSVGEKVKSISSVYTPAFLIENEYQDLFGITFENLIIDYKGSLYLAPEAPKSPLAIKDEKGV